MFFDMEACGKKSSAEDRYRRSLNVKSFAGLQAPGHSLTGNCRAV